MRQTSLLSILLAPIFILQVYFIASAAPDMQSENYKYKPTTHMQPISVHF